MPQKFWKFKMVNIQGQHLKCCFNVGKFANLLAIDSIVARTKTIILENLGLEQFQGKNKGYLRQGIQSQQF